MAKDDLATCLEYIEGNLLTAHFALEVLKRPKAPETERMIRDENVDLLAEHVTAAFLLSLILSLSKIWDSNEDLSFPAISMRFKDDLRERIRGNEAEISLKQVLHEIEKFADEDVIEHLRITRAEGFAHPVMLSESKRRKSKRNSGKSYDDALKFSESEAIWQRSCDLMVRLKALLPLLYPSTDDDDLADVRQVHELMAGKLCDWLRSS